MHFETRKNRILFYGVLLSLGSIFIRWYSLNAFSIVDDESQDWKSNCEYTLKDWIYTMDSICISEKFLPNMTLSEIVNKTWNQISDFSEYYQPFEESFNYHGAIPSFQTKWSPYLQENENSDRLISDAIKSRKKISFSEIELAQYYAKHLSYFVADKDLAKLWNCTHRNYSLALESLDNYVLKPWDTLNINQKLSTIQNYCRWQTKQYHLFYGWVCGMVSQLFRVSLQNPNIAVIERSPHNERFVQYYGETIWWDDASVYERSKQFEIQNKGNSDIIFLKSAKNEIIPF